MEVVVGDITALVEVGEVGVVPVTLERVTFSLDVISKSGTFSEGIVAFFLSKSGLRLLEGGEHVKGRL